VAQPAYDRLLDRLRADGRTVRETRAGQAQAHCPAHEDAQASLSLTKIKQQALMYCHAGCETKDVLAALGWKMRDLFDNPRGASYDYFNTAGERVRTVLRTPGKRFTQSVHSNGQAPTLYRLPEVIAAVDAGKIIYLPEGEKDVHALESLGVVATTAPMGAANFRKVDVSPLTNARVVAIVDQDRAGQKWATHVRDKLQGVAAALVFKRAKVGKDAADHIAAGHGVDDFEGVEIEPPADVVGGANVYSRTDDGNALRLIDDYGRQFRRVADMRKWFVWDGCRWALDYEDRAIRQATRELARELPTGSEEDKRFRRNSMSAVGISGCVRVAETDPRVSIRAAELDAHPELLNTPSGVVDLRTGEIRPHDPGLLLTRITAYPIDLDAPHPRWDAFLAETFPGQAGPELIGYLQRLAGLALMGSVREHVLPFAWGKGANGKGVITLVLQGLLGDADNGGYAVSAPDGFLMAGRDNVHPTEIARLRGARLVVCSEQTGGKRFDESKVKRLTGGDVLTGRFMRGDFFDFRPSHLVWVLSNHLPAVREGGPAFWRRVRLIPFKHVVPEDQRIDDLDQQLLEAEASAILGWATRGAVEVLAGGLADPAAVIKATEEYQVSEDTVASFVRDECLLGPNYWCKISDLRARYERHCEEMGAEPLSGKALGMRLTNEYPVTSNKHTKLKVRTYVGIALQGPDDESAESGDR
jgi:P4 family phage/plasmid primase-like protien